MAAVAMYRKDTSGELATTGSASAYVLALATTSVAALSDGMKFSFRANHTNTGASTLNVNSIGAVAIVRGTSTALVAGDIVSGAIYTVTYVLGSTHFRLHTAHTTTFAGNVAFPATQVPSSDANTLDDYEEGTWTPTITFATPGNLAVTYSAQTGRYTKIGRQVFYEVRLITSSFTHTTASGILTLAGLPFAAAATGLSAGACALGGYTKAGFTQIFLETAATVSAFAFLATGSAVSPASLTTNDMPTAGTVTIVGGGHYSV